MIANLIILVFVLVMVYVWAMQGLFSGLIHLLLTIFAGALALAIWEPLVIRFLINRMPEYAWGVGLIVPFVLILFLLRFLFDRFILGNVNFNQIIDLVGGGAMGLLSALIGGGLLLIGLQFIGPSPLNYQPLAIQPNGQLARKDTLWIPADRTAGALFTMLSNNALSPFSNQTVGNLYGNLADDAARFRIESRQGARHTIAPANLTTTWTRIAAADPRLPKDLAPSTGRVLLLVTTEIQQKAFDPDGVFTVAAGQVTLGYYANAQSTDHIERMNPAWYLQRNALGRFKGVGFACSKAGVGRETFHWAFEVPAEAVPVYLTIKKTRQVLSDEPASAKGLLDQVVWVEKPHEQPNNNGSPTIAPPTNGSPVAAEGLTIRVSSLLPFAINRNDVEMSNGKVAKDEQDNNVLTSINGTIKPPTRTNLSYNLRVAGLYKPKNTAIIQLTLKIKKYRALWGATAAMAQATSFNPPQLVDADSDTYLPLGYAVNMGGNAFVRYTPDQPIERLAEIDLKPYAENQQVILYYRVPKGVRLVEFRLGQHKQALNLTVSK